MISSAARSAAALYVLAAQRPLFWGIRSHVPAKNPPRLSTAARAFVRTHELDGPLTDGFTSAARVFATFSAALVLMLCIQLAWADSEEGDPLPMDPYRQAILVGSWTYSAGAPLSDMTTDLDSLESALNLIKFDSIQTLKNPTADEVLKAVDQAAVKAKAQGETRSVLTVIFFGGHGMMVQNTSYLLASNYTGAADSSEIALNGGVRVDLLAQPFGLIKEPVLIIVDACRNPFTPTPQTPANDSSLNLASGGGQVTASAAPPTNYVMIGKPSENGNFGYAYSQAPGEVVEIDDPDPSKPTPFVQAIVDLLPNETNFTPLFASVYKRVNDATLTQQHPQQPHSELVGLGETHFYYNLSARVVDDTMWASYSNSGRLDQMQNFIVAYPTSRYIPVARVRIAKYTQSVEQPKAEVAYVQRNASTRMAMGSNRISATVGGLFRGGVTAVDNNAFHDVMKSDGTLATVRTAEIETIRRLPTAEPKFEVRLNSGERVQPVGDVVNADASRLNEFWKDPSVAAVLCEPQAIADRKCAAVESFVTASAGKDARRVGTVFVASVLDSSRPGFDSQHTSAVVQQIETRLSSAGIIGSAVGFRLFFGSDFPSAPGPVLMKRGDGSQLVPAEGK